ncbi:MULTISPECIES: hypothetical protein [unclassified Kribbella]|uniref:hypothetical protein n=1 Tax=unclassified Kribbella TaxID=2644121 RepID=UPI00301B34A9
MVIWAVTIPIFWYVTLHNLRRRRTFHGVALTLWFVLVLALITEQFWSYWRTLG